MQDLRQALEELDEALDRLEEQAAARPAQAHTITPRAPGGFSRMELIRLLDSTITDAQSMLERAA